MLIHAIPSDMIGNRDFIIKKLLQFGVVKHRRSLVVIYVILYLISIFIISYVSLNQQTNKLKCKLSLSPYSPVEKSKSFGLSNRFPVLTTDEDNTVKLNTSIKESNDLVQVNPNK